MKNKETVFVISRLNVNKCSKEDLSLNYVIIFMTRLYANDLTFNLYL